MWSRCSVVALALLSCRPDTTVKDSAFKVAAEDLGLAYCTLAFSDGCSVPEDCGLPGGFGDADDCEARLVPFLRSCAVPEDEAEPVIAELDACREVLETASCDDPLCGDGPLDTDPCLGLFDTLAGYCTFSGLGD